MRIPRVHVECALAAGADIALADAQSHYLKHVLRLKPGAALFLFNGIDGLDYRAQLDNDGKRLIARIDTPVPVDTQSALACEIIQGLARADHMDWMIQKTTELGVHRIRLFYAERSQSRLKAQALQKKLRHWRGVAISACEQSGRALLPEILFHGDFGEAIGACSADLRLLLDFDAESLAARMTRPVGSVGLLLGPEGGLTTTEIETAIQAGFQSANLGPRVLRTETAATSAISIVQALAGDLR